MRWLCFLALPLFCHADPLSLLIGGSVALAGGGFYAFREKISCYVLECCNVPFIKPDFDMMDDELRRNLYGQHIVLDTVVPAVRAHFTKQPQKPLVLSFHGYTGSGKNYVASIIARNIYKKGLKSNFVHHIVATAEFPDKTRLEEYKTKLVDRIVKAVGACPHTLIILDEVDKMPEKLLSAIKPYMDYYDSVKGVDFRHAIFVLLSNAGGEAISRLTVEQRKAGKLREQIKVAQLEREVSSQVYNAGGGLRLSELISNHLIDHFIPFLPLEKDHVRKCITFYLENVAMGGRAYAHDTELIDQIAGSLQYFPPDDPIFSSSGCKRVGQKTDVLLHQKREKNRQAGGGFVKLEEHDEI